MTRLPLNVNPVSYFTRLIAKRFDLMQRETIRQTLSTDIEFVTVATAVKLLRPLPRLIFSFSIFGFITIFDNLRASIESTDEGYLSHNGSRLKFQTPEQTIFDIPLSSVSSVEYRSAKPRGVILKTSAGTYHLGSALPLNSNELSARSVSVDSDNYAYGDMNGWMAEFANLGLVSKAELLKHAASNKRSTKIFLTLFLVLTLIILISAFLR